MGRLNEPREVPYRFKVIILSNEACLIDESEAMYPCSPQAHFAFEPLYELTPEVGDTCWGDSCGQVIGDEHEESLHGGEFECPSCRYPYDGLAKLEPGLVLVSEVDLSTSVDVPLDDEDKDKDNPRVHAWDAAREVANGNHLV